MDPLVSKVATGIASQLAPEARGLVSRLLGPAVDELGVMLRDSVLDRRRRNLERIAAKAAARVTVEASTVSRIPSRTMIPLLEAASLEDDDSGLEEQWAGLLASAASGIPVLSSYPRILAEMTPADARLLSSLDRLTATPRRPQTPTVADIGADAGISGQGLFDNLLRLRLCSIGVPQPGEVVGRRHLALLDVSFLEMTALGIGFLTACRGPVQT